MDDVYVCIDTKPKREIYERILDLQVALLQNENNHVCFVAKLLSLSYIISRDASVEGGW